MEGQRKDGRMVSRKMLQTYSDVATGDLLRKIEMMEAENKGGQNSNLSQLATGWMDGWTSSPAQLKTSSEEGHSRMAKMLAVINQMQRKPSQSRIS